MQKTRNYFILLILLTSIISCQNVNNKTDNSISGPEKYLSKSCNDSCIIKYKKYTIITKNHNESPGEDIIVINNDSKIKTPVDVSASYNAQYFFGLYNDKLIIDAGTYVIRKFYIYDLKTKTSIFSTSYSGKLDISNHQISFTYVYGIGEKPEKMPSEQQKKEIEKIGADYGIVEHRVYDFTSNKIILKENTRYSTY